MHRWVVRLTEQRAYKMTSSFFLVTMVDRKKICTGSAISTFTLIARVWVFSGHYYSSPPRVFIYAWEHMHVFVCVCVCTTMANYLRYLTRNGDPPPRFWLRCVRVFWNTHQTETTAGINTNSRVLVCIYSYPPSAFKSNQLLLTFGNTISVSINFFFSKQESTWIYLLQQCTPIGKSVFLFAY